MTVFQDCTQVLRPTTRRITATWTEQQGRRVMLVPRTASGLAPGVTPGGMLTSERDLRERAKEAANAQRLTDAVHARIALWWLEQWNDPHGLYQVAELGEGQERLKEELLEAMPEAGFRRPGEDIHAHPDAEMVAEALALGGSLLVTNNVRSMDHEKLNEWVGKFHNEFGLANERVLIEPDEWLDTELWQNVPRVEEHRAKLMLQALWPKETDADTDRVVEEVQNVLQRGPGQPFRRNRERASAVLELASELGILRGWIEEVRSGIDTAARRAEQRHPTWRGTAPGR